MQPQLCSKCKKNVAVVFITRADNGQNINEGLCLKCAKNLGIPQVNEMMRRMGITDEDLDNLSNEGVPGVNSHSLKGLRVCLRIMRVNVCDHINCEDSEK